MYMPYDRYKFESNSQRAACRGGAATRCICHMIDTSLKAIHNVRLRISSLEVMYMPYDRYKFESNSQLVLFVGRHLKGCICHMIDTSLKAIHNVCTVPEITVTDVYAICEIQV